MMGAGVFLRLALVATVLAYGVVVLGATVRLAGAGLSCPDWPGCYGEIIVPQGEGGAEAAALIYPERPLEHGKAWIEMIHRYAAGLLGLLIALLAVIAWRDRQDPRQQFAIPIFAAAVVIVQALLGMWTVTLLLQPLVVVAHLLGGVAILVLLWWVVLRQGQLFVEHSTADAAQAGKIVPWVAVGLVVTLLQLALGGWTSANYAALVCPDFPTCRGQWWPPMAFSEAFTPWRAVEGGDIPGVLSLDALVTVQMMHRLGAALTVCVVGALAFWAVFQENRGLLRMGATLFAILALQVALGIANVVLALPLPVAVAHNGVAALLLLTLATLLHLVKPYPKT